MSSYHIDQLGRIVKQVAEKRYCEGCLYEHDEVDSRVCCLRTAPVENRLSMMPSCGENKTIYVLVDTTK